MAKEKVNLFKQAKERRNARVSDRDYFEEMEAKMAEPKARKPGRPPKANKVTNMRTTLNMTEEDFCLMNDLVYTIQSSGQHQFLDEGDFRLTKKEFWGLALKNMKKQVEKLYGEVKTSPETQSIKG